MRRLGATGILISPIGLGTWQFSQGKGLAGHYWSILDNYQVENIVSASLSGGINWFDTAEVYGNGQSEIALSGALKKCGITPGQVVIATKWWPFPRTARSIIKTIDRRLSCLQGFPIDLYQVHQPWGLSNILEEMDAMAALVDMGKIKSIGLSNHSADQMKRAHEYLSKKGIPMASNQVKYNLLDRQIEKDGVLEAAKELGISIIAYSPLEQGILTGKFHKDPSIITTRRFRRKLKSFSRSGLEKSYPLIRLLEEKARKYRVSAAEIALNWLVNFHGETVVAIPGASSMRQAETNAGAMKFTMTPEDMNEIDEISLAVANQ